jgi:hypothetical protein
LITRLAGWRGRDSVSPAKISNSGEQENQDGNDGGQSGASIFDPRFAESLHTIAYNFNSGHRSAAARERFHQ